MAANDLLPWPSFLRRSIGKYALVVILLIVSPILLGMSLAIQILILAIFTLGYNLLFGYGGELSFGHAAFYGIGVYGTIMTAQLFQNIYIAMVAGIVLATVIGAVFQWISLHQRGIYYAMITLALAQMVYYAALQWSSITGGFNGLALTNLSQSYRLLAVGQTNLTLFAVCSGVLIFVWAGLHRLINSPYGMILISVRENEKRARTLGYNTDNILLLAATISSAISGIAGALHAVLFAYVNPNVLFWTVSGEVVLATLIGGAGTLTGPVIGAVVFEFLSNTLPEFFSVWELVFGIIIVLVVAFAPEGIYGYINSIRNSDDWKSMNIRDLFDRLFERS